MIRCPSCQQPMVSTSGDLCYGCGWKLPAAANVPPAGKPAAFYGMFVSIASGLGIALDKLEAFDASNTSLDAHDELARILDDICREWKTLKEKP